MTIEEENILLNDILIVDDQPENLRVLSQILEEQNYKVRKAINGELALRATQLNPPDLILLDIQMPNLDGYQVCQQLKKNKQTQDIPVIFVSALNELFDKVEAFKVGAVDYISKPFQVEEVLARIKNQLIIQEQKRQLQLEIKERKNKEEELKNEIIKRRETEEILYQSRALLQSVLNSSLDGIAAFQSIRQDYNGKIIDFRCLVVNPIMAEIIGKEREKLIGKLIFTQILRKIGDTFFDKLVSLVETGNPLVEELYYYNKNLPSWYHITAVKLGDGFSITVRDISEHKKMELELQRITKTDCLTNVGNRRNFQETINQTWQIAQREKQPLSMIICDVDFFKKYNDYYGHQMGDLCLVQVAQALSDCVKRPTDSVSRYGGEEFAVILANTSLEGALKVAEKIRQTVEALKISHEKSEISDFVTLSCGVASMKPRLGLLLETLIKNADEALYLSKQRGRNRVSY